MQLFVLVYDLTLRWDCDVLFLKCCFSSFDFIIEMRHFNKSRESFLQEQESPPSLFSVDEAFVACESGALL